MDEIENSIELSSWSESSSSASSGLDFEMPRLQSSKSKNNNNNNNNDSLSNPMQEAARTTTFVGTSTNGIAEFTGSLHRRRMSIHYAYGEASSSRMVRRNLIRGASGNANIPNTGVQTTILSWLIDLRIVFENERFICVVGNAVSMRTGRARRNGVSCICCNQIMTVSEFAAHVGSDQPDGPHADVRVARTDESLLRCNMVALETLL